MKEGGEESSQEKRFTREELKSELERLSKMEYIFGDRNQGSLASRRGQQH
jgi:hypothetical protein